MWNRRNIETITSIKVRFKESFTNDLNKKNHKNTWQEREKAARLSI